MASLAQAASAVLLSPPRLCSFWAVDTAHDPVAGACKVLALALEMQHAVLDAVMPDGQPAQARIGIHTGSCVSGLVGLSPPRWSVWGDTGGHVTCVHVGFQLDTLGLICAHWVLLVPH